MPDCGWPEHVRGYCRTHYARLVRGDDLTAPVKRRRHGVIRCSIGQCRREMSADGMCAYHYGRVHTAKLTREQAENGHDKRRRETPRSHLNNEGYRVVYVRAAHGAMVPRLEHRHVMELALCRPIRRNEHVHHKNGFRDDNRLTPGHELGGCPPTCCNLELWAKVHPSGQRVRDLLAWATDIIERYAKKGPAPAASELP